MKKFENNVYIFSLSNEISLNEGFVESNFPNFERLQPRILWIPIDLWNYLEGIHVIYSISNFLDQCVVTEVWNLTIKMYLEVSKTLSFR